MRPIPKSSRTFDRAPFRTLAPEVANGGSGTRPGSEGFSLIEILVTVSLLTLIILGLFAVFNQTQKAFRSTMNQTDTLEAGRAVNGGIGRDLEQLAPSYLNTLNFYSQLLNETPLVQDLPGPQPSGVAGRTNLLQDVFILTRDSGNWVGIGYCVRTNDSQGRLWLPEIQPGSPGLAGVGYLYRYSYTLPCYYTNGASTGLPQDPGVIFNGFKAAATPGSVLMSNRVCDGVIHFRFRTYDTNGVLIVSGPPSNTIIQTNSVLAPGEVWSYAFYSNAVPAFVEMELGLLEPRKFARYNSIGDPVPRLAYAKRADVTAGVQLFRQRIAVRNFDPSAFQ